MDDKKIEELLSLQIPQLNEKEEGIKENPQNFLLSTKEKTRPPLAAEDEPSKFEKRLITYLHARFLATGEYPKQDKLYRDFPELNDHTAKQLLSIFRKVNLSLENRDLPKFHHRNTEFDPRFVVAVGLITNPADTRSLTAKCKSAGITTTKWNNFLKVKKNLKFFQDRMDEAYASETFEMGRVALARNVAEGDLSSIKYFNEMTGKYSSVDNSLDGRVVAMLMQTILSIIANNVDGNTARKIADEIDQAAPKVIDLQ